MNNTIKNILICTNFSTSFDTTLVTGIAMCKRHNATLHLLHVNEKKKFLIVKDAISDSFEDIITELEDRAKSIRTEHQLQCIIHKGGGELITSLKVVVDKSFSDLLIIERPAYIKRFSLFGKKSILNIIEHISCPVLTIPPNVDHLTFGKILFPVRPSWGSLEKFDFSLPIIKKNDAQVLLFAPIAFKNKEEDLVTIKSLFKYANFLKVKDEINFEQEITYTNDSAREVVDKAIQMKSDLIIISATLKKGLMDLLNTSYTESVIDNSPVPVLSIKIK